MPKSDNMNSTLQIHYLFDHLLLYIINISEKKADEEKKEK